MSLAILFYFLCTQHVLDINISIIRSLRLCGWITTLVILFLVRCVLEIWCGCRLKHNCASACNTDTTQTQPHQISNTQRTKNKTTDVVIQQHSRKLLMMDVLISETCWVHKKWNKIASDIKLVFYSSTVFNVICGEAWYLWRSCSRFDCQTYSTHMKWKLPATEGILVPCGSIVGRFHCITVLQARYSCWCTFFPTPTPISFPLRRKIVVWLEVNILVDDEYSVCLRGNNSSHTILRLLLWD